MGSAQRRLRRLPGPRTNWDRLGVFASTLVLTAAALLLVWQDDTGRRVLYALIAFGFALLVIGIFKGHVGSGGNDDNKPVKSAKGPSLETVIAVADGTGSIAGPARPRADRGLGGKSSRESTQQIGAAEAGGADDSEGGHS